MQSVQEFVQDWEGLADYVKKLHSWGMRTILIYDPAIQVDYASFQRAITSVSDSRNAKEISHETEHDAM